MEKTVSQAKPARAKKPSAQEQAKATIAKMKQTALPLPSPTTAPGELAMVPIELIDTTNQVRTVFFEDSIKELAADIAARGILQPLLLRPTPGGRFCIIAGERRYRAASLALLTHVPALIGEIDEEAAQLMQLAENILPRPTGELPFPRPRTLKAGAFLAPARTAWQSGIFVI